METNETLNVGETYKVKTSRFGSAVVKILKQCDEWADCEIVSGKLIGMTEEWRTGDTKTLRKSHSIFTPNATGYTTAKKNRPIHKNEN